MEINPFEARLRMLEQMDGIRMQREATPDEETAGCPGCPYFWTCPVPHRGEEVRAPEEIELEDVRGTLGTRRDFIPRDESDIGWTDVWVDEEGLSIAEEDLRQVPSTEPPADTDTGTGIGTAAESATDAGPGTDAEAAPGTPRPRRTLRELFRRRR